MQLQRIKVGLSALWVFTIVGIAIALDVSWAGGTALLALGALPPLALLLLWNDPRPTMSESINDARR